MSSSRTFLPLSPLWHTIVGGWAVLGGGGQLGSIPGCGFMQRQVSTTARCWQSRAYPASSIPTPTLSSWTSEVEARAPFAPVTCDPPFSRGAWWCPRFPWSRRRAWTRRPCRGRWRAAGWQVGAQVRRVPRGRSQPRPTMPPPVTSRSRSQRRGSRASRSSVFRRRASRTSTCTTRVFSSLEQTGAFQVSSIFWCLGHSLEFWCEVF